MLTAPRFPRPGSQRGAGALEFTIIAIPVLMVALAAIEISRWFLVKQALSLALLEAGRAGIVDHARPSTIETAFELALLPVYAAPSRQQAYNRLQQALTQRRQRSGAPPWQIVIVSPSRAAFTDFASRRVSVSDAQGLDHIDNNYQAEQHQRHIQQGWPSGRGPASGGTIFDANSLVLQLSYMHEPLVPGMQGLMRLLAPLSQGHAKSAYASGYLPLRQTLRLAMQSHPVAWPQSSDKVLTSAPGLFSALSGVQPPCNGIWCLGRGRLPANPLLPNSEQPPQPGESLLRPVDPPYSPEQPVTLPSSETAGSGRNENTVPVDPKDVCGTVLCCL